MNQRGDECDLLRRTADGDQQALAGLFEQYRERLGRAIRLRMDRRLHGRIDISDVLQDAFVDASRRLPEYVSAADVSLFVWLRSLTLQRLVDLHRQHLGTKMRSAAREISFQSGIELSTSSLSLAEWMVDSTSSPANKAVHTELQLRVHDALNNMEPIDQEVLAMRHFELMTNGEVADVLELSKAAASNRYIRALKRLHVVLNGGLDDSE